MAGGVIRPLLSSFFGVAFVGWLGFGTGWFLGLGIVGGRSSAGDDCRWTELSWSAFNLAGEVAEFRCSEGCGGFRLSELRWSSGCDSEDGGGLNTR